MTPRRKAGTDQSGIGTGVLGDPGHDIDRLRKIGGEEITILHGMMKIQAGEGKSGKRGSKKEKLEKNRWRKERSAEKKDTKKMNGKNRKGNKKLLQVCCYFVLLG